MFFISYRKLDLMISKYLKRILSCRKKNGLDKIVVVVYSLLETPGRQNLR